MSLLLTDKEIQAAIDDVLDGNHGGNDFFQAIADAATKKAVEEIDNKMLEDRGCYPCYCGMHIKNWQAIKKEAGL